MADSDDTLDTVQQVLRGVVVSLALSAKVDLPQCAASLKSFAADGNLDPMAQVMLNDLAHGLELIGQAMPKAS
jgi:hypothetical protein